VLRKFAANSVTKYASSSRRLRFLRAGGVIFFRFSLRFPPSIARQGRPGVVKGQVALRVPGDGGGRGGSPQYVRGRTVRRGAVTEGAAAGGGRKEKKLTCITRCTPHYALHPDARGCAGASARVTAAIVKAYEPRLGRGMLGPGNPNRSEVHRTACPALDLSISRLENPESSDFPRKRAARRAR